MLSSTSFQPLYWRRSDIRNCSRYLSRAPCRAVGVFDACARSISSSEPVRPPKRSTSSSRNPRRTLPTARIRRTRLRVSSQHSSVQAPPRVPEHELIGANRQRIFAGFDQDRLRGGLEETLRWRREPRQISGGNSSEYQFFLRRKVFFEFLAVPEIGGLGRSLAKQVAGLIVKVSGVGAVALARDQDRDGVRGIRQFHDLRRGLAAGAHHDGAAPVGR